MPFLNNYLEYNSGNECPRNYHLWSALVVLAATMQKKVYIDWGYFTIYPNLYVGLIGKQGSRKSTAKDIGRDIYVSTFPDMPIGASVTSREDIIRFMSSDEGMRVFKNERDELVEYRPFTLFINELKNFLSFNASGMLDFLTDIYDRKVFDSSTLKRGLENIENPCVNLIACETPSWIISRLKDNIITGGFARRIIYVYEIDRPNRISFPTLPPNAKELLDNLRAHLKKISTITGQFKWTSSASRFFDKWYQGKKIPDDEIMEGYYESKHIQLLKVAMLIALSDDYPVLRLEEQHLVLALGMLDAIEVNMPKLSAAAGRNELALPTQRVIEVLERNGGAMPQKILMRDMARDLAPNELVMVLRFLTDTGQIVTGPFNVNGVTKLLVMTTRKKEELERAAREAQQTKPIYPSEASEAS